MVGAKGIGKTSLIVNLYEEFKKSEGEDQVYHFVSTTFEYTTIFCMCSVDNFKVTSVNILSSL